MGTRPGALDPGVVLYLFQSLGLSAKEVETILYKKSGLLGISGISNDMRDLLARREPEARLAVDYFVYRAAKEIGALGCGTGRSRWTRVHRRHWRELTGNPPANLRGVFLARRGTGRTTPTPIEVRGYLRSESKVSTWVIPTERGIHDRTPHRRASWID